MSSRCDYCRGTTAPCPHWFFDSEQHASADDLDDALAYELANQPRALSPDIDRWTRRVASLARRLRARRDREGLTAPMRRAPR